MIMTEMIKERNQNAYGQHRSGRRIVAAMMVAFVDSLALNPDVRGPPTPELRLSARHGVAEGVDLGASFGLSAQWGEEFDTALAVGKTPERALQPFGRVPPVEIEDGEVLAWSNGQAEPLRLVQGKAQVRHRRKYAAGDLGGEAFVFRGPQGKLKLRARNLDMFLQMAEGVDEETWMHHLAQRDYSKWFRTVVKDDGLAAEAEQIESGGGPESRDRIRDAIGRRYTLPE